jgi:peptide/nickel transport system permease protein
LTGYILRRTASAVFVLVLTSVLIFSLGRLLPGDPITVIAGPNSELTIDQMAALRKDYGFDQPIPVQYAIWLQKLLSGDFGTSFTSKQPVPDVIASRLLPTIQIGLQTILIASVVGISVGILSAIGRGSRKEAVVSAVTLSGAAIPYFLTASILMIVFALALRWLPASGYTPITENPIDSVRTTLMPSLVLAFALAAIVARQMRTSLLEVMQQPFIRTARSKGLSDSAVLRGHALKNAFLPVLTILGYQIAFILGGAVITESIFGIPGLGRLLVDSVGSRDYAVTQILVLMIAITVVIVNLVIDILYVFLDPRISLSHHGN